MFLNMYRQVWQQKYMAGMNQGMSTPDHYGYTPTLHGTGTKTVTATKFYTLLGEYEFDYSH